MKKIIYWCRDHRVITLCENEKEAKKLRDSEYYASVAEYCELDHVSDITSEDEEDYWSDVYRKSHEVLTVTEMIQTAAEINADDINSRVIQVLHELVKTGRLNS